MAIETRNPATGEMLATYQLMSPKEVNAIICQTHETYLDWRESDFVLRQQLLEKLAQLLIQGQARIAALITREMGKPISEAMAEVEKCAWLANYYAENAATLLRPRRLRLEKDCEATVRYQPLGIVFAIMPWNFPLWQVFRFLCPSLMAGNAALLSHSENVTGVALLIEELVEAAGFPAQLFRSLLISNEQAESVIAHPYVTGVTLTGSERAGRSVASLAGQYLKKVVLELGGSDPYIILEDADLDHAADVCVAARLKNAGQVCIAAKRIIVVESVLKAFEEKILARVAAYKMGDPSQPTCNFGPMAREDLRDHIHEQVQTSIREGARLVVGGELPSGVGFYYPPTVLCDVTEKMLPFKEEMFGPVVTIIPAEDEADALRLANLSDYGLGAAIFTRDLDKGEMIASEMIEAGAVAVNQAVASDPRVPFGGIKNSGFGRELSEEGIREFVNTKTVVVRG